METWSLVAETGYSPKRQAYIRMPRLHQSTRWSYGRTLNTSGAISKTKAVRSTGRGFTRQSLYTAMFHRWSTCVARAEAISTGRSRWSWYCHVRPRECFPSSHRDRWYLSCADSRAPSPPEQYRFERSAGENDVCVAIGREVHRFRRSRWWCRDSDAIANSNVYVQWMDKKDRIERWSLRLERVE